MSPIRSSVLVVAIVGALVLAACGDGSDEDTNLAGDENLTLRIGYSGALSGPYAPYDEPVLRGMEFAAEQINAEGGPVEVEIEFADNQGDQNTASTDVQRMLDDGITTFVTTTGDAILAQVELIHQSGGLVTIGGSTAPTVLEVGERAFLLSFGDNTQSAAMAEFACGKGYETAYTIGSPEIPYTAENPRYFEDAFAEICDGEVIGTDTYEIGQTDWSTQIGKIKSANPQPDLVFSPIFVPDTGGFVKQLRGAGVDLPYLGLDGNDSPLYWEAGGAAVDRTAFATHAFPSQGSEVAKFNEELEAATGKPPESVFELKGAEHVYALVEAVIQAGSIEPDAMADAIRAFDGLELPTGELTMDPETRVPLKTVYVVEMDGTKPTLAEKIVPEYVPAP